MSGKTEVADQPPPSQRTSIFAEWRWWLAPAMLSLALILIFVDPFIGDWDAFEYTLSALRGSPSSMALGRMLFIFLNHGLYLLAHSIFGLPREQAYLLFKYAVVAQGPIAVVACWKLAREVTASAYAATVSAWLVAFSPVFVLYSGEVMTDVPAMLLLTVALIVHLRGATERRVWLVIAGAGLLGAGVNLRETIGFYLPWLLFAQFVCGWPANRRPFLSLALALSTFLVFALAPFGIQFLLNPIYRAAWHGWRESMEVESSLHPLSMQNVWIWLGFLFATSPLVFLSLIPAALKVWRSQRLSPILLLASVGFFADLLLLLNYSTSIGWRYFLTGMPALVPISASYLTQMGTRLMKEPGRAVISICLVIVLIGVVFGILLWPLRSEHARVRATSKTYYAELKELPHDAVIIPGAQSIAVRYWRELGKGQWEVIAAGAGWPGAQLPAVIDNYLKQNRRVFVDANPLWWQPCGWHVAEIEELAKLETHFHFRQVASRIYEIRPKEDQSANDHPRLESLLPMNRPQDVKKCTYAG